MKYLVTGGAGFIGSHLTEELLKNGNLVSVYDDLSSGYRSNLVKCQKPDYSPGLGSHYSSP